MGLIDGEFSDFVLLKLSMQLMLCSHHECQKLQSFTKVLVKPWVDVIKETHRTG